MSRPYTEADVDLLDHALVDADCPHGAIGPGHVGCTLACSRCIARKALTALAAAGRLIPDVWTDNPDHAGAGDYPDGGEPDRAAEYERARRAAAEGGHPDE